MFVRCANFLQFNFVADKTLAMALSSFDIPGPDLPMAFLISLWYSNDVIVVSKMIKYLCRGVMKCVAYLTYLRSLIDLGVFVLGEISLQISVE